MEQDGEQLSARPALESEGLRFLHVTVGSLLAAYGWYLVFGCILLLAVFQKLSARLRASGRRRDPAAAAVAPEDVVRRQEALAAARLKMQEELNAQVERHKEKLRQLEEDKRRRKIEMWDSMQEGKSYRGHATKPQEDSSSLPQRPADRKKPLRGSGYNPLSGEGGEPAPGGLVAEAHQLVDEAKTALPPCHDTKQANAQPPHAQTPSIALRTSHSDQPRAHRAHFCSTLPASAQHQWAAAPEESADSQSESKDR